MALATAHLTTRPDWVGELRFACPKCHASLEAPDGRSAPHCALCGFAAILADGVTSFIPRSTNYQWLDYYEARASGTEANTPVGVGYSSPLQHRYMVEGFARICGPVPIGASVLDVGCGNGLFWSTLFGSRPVVGVDFSHRMCRLAQARGMLAYQADALALPFADDQFDLIYSAEVLQHIDDLRALVAEVTRVCRRGGRIIISTLNQRSWYRKAFFFGRGFIPRRIMSRPQRAIMRTAAELAAAGRTVSLALGGVCWTHYPLPYIHCAAGKQYALEPLASNVIVELVKA